MPALLPIQSSRSEEERKHIRQSLQEKHQSKIPFHVTWTQFMSSEAKNHLVAGIGEFIGTFLFLWFAFAGTSIANLGVDDAVPDVAIAAMTTSDAANNSGRLVYISLAFGISLMVNAWVFFRISGGLFNPAVTIALALLRDVTLSRAILLCTVQCGAACFAAWLVDIMYPTPMRVQASLSSGTSWIQGLFIEAICTAMLVFTIIMLAKEKHRATFIAPIGIGLALFIGELVSVNFTGGALNPARFLGPAAVNRDFVGIDWIYGAGPIIGAIVAVILYKLFKVMEYEMVNPGQDGDYTNDPTQNPDHELAIKVDSRQAQVDELRTIKSQGGFRAFAFDPRPLRSEKEKDKSDVRFRQESSSTAVTYTGDYAAHGGGGGVGRDLEANHPRSNQYGNGNMKRGVRPARSPPHEDDGEAEFF